MRSSSCLWKRTWVKNSRVPWSPKAAKDRWSAASGPEHVSTGSASTVTSHEATHGVPATIRSQRSSIGWTRPVDEAEVRLVVHAVQALHDGLLQLVDDLGALAGRRIDPVDALVVDLHLEVRSTSSGSSAATSACGCPWRGSYEGSRGALDAPGPLTPGRRVREARRSWDQ